MRNPKISCGCIGRPVPTRSKEKHGKRWTPEYSAWLGMIGRCTNQKDASYQYYGDRGITVCDRWLNSFQSFYEDMGDRPSSDMSLDRFPNVDGNYEPGNVRWATDHQQRLNQRRSKKYAFRDQELYLIEWCKFLNIPKNTLCNRLIMRKWTVEEALTTPLGEKRSFYDLPFEEIAARNAAVAGKFGRKLDEDKVKEIQLAHAGKSKSNNEIASEFGVSEGTIKAIVGGRRWAIAGDQS